MAVLLILTAGTILGVVAGVHLVEAFLGKRDLLITIIWAAVASALVSLGVSLEAQQLDAAFHAVIVMTALLASIALSIGMLFRGVYYLICLR